MIKLFVERFMENKGQIRQKLKNHPRDYSDLVKIVFEAVTGDNYGEPDPERITEIDHGDYQGILVYVIAGKGYQPSEYWYVKVGYGSCSHCDTLESIHDGFSDDEVTEEQINDYMTLCLHIVQAIKKMGEDSA